MVKITSDSKKENSAICTNKFLKSHFFHEDNHVILLKETITEKIELDEFDFNLLWKSKYCAILSEI